METFNTSAVTKNTYSTENGLGDWGVPAVDSTEPSINKIVMGRRGFLRAFGVGVALVATHSFAAANTADKYDTPNGLVEKKLNAEEEKVFTPTELEHIFKENKISRSDYYRPDALSADEGRGSPFVRERVKARVTVLKDVPVVYPESAEPKNKDYKSIFIEKITLNLPVSQALKDELVKAEDNTNNGKVVKRVVGHGLIVEAETVKGRGWVILPPGTLLAKLDDKVVIASCLNPIYKIEKRKCPPCK